MSRLRPQEGCHDLAFDHAYAITDAGEVALEDYARALAGSRSAEAIADPSDPGRVQGVHVCGAGAELTAVRAEVQEFARDLARRAQEARPSWE